MNRICVGFNLGDRESITDYVCSNEIDTGWTTYFREMIMPGCKDGGRAIPTGFGHDEKGNLVVGDNILWQPDVMDDIHRNFRHRPCDLLGNFTEERERELYQLFSVAGRIPLQAQCPECYISDIQTFRKDIITFTNAIFEDAEYMKNLSVQAQDCDEMIFCVGYPDGWTSLDVAVYKAFLSESVLGKGAYIGKKAYLVMEMESRAVLRCVRDRACKEFLPKGTSAVVVNVGEEGIGITALAPGDAECQYTNCDRYLGETCIDHIVKAMYLERLQQDTEKWEKYRVLCEICPSYDESVTLACRMAKEAMYANSSPDSKVRIDPEGIDFKMKVRTSEIDEYIKNHSVADVLAASTSLPPEVQKRMGSKNWMQLFRDFMMEGKSQISKRSIKVGRIILTGNASKMPFVPEIVKEIFSELANGGVLVDMNPYRTISMGLSLAGLRIQQQEELKACGFAVI